MGDAVGLRREGLSRRRAMRLYGGSPLRPELLFGRGLCSDDTEHTQIVGRALLLSGGDLGLFEQELARQFRRWVLTVPAGVGLATLRACGKLLLGFGPRHSGVFSAGNGPVMRSALIGVLARSDDQLRALVRSSTRITHTDPKAEEGAWLIARAARTGTEGAGVPPIEFLDRVAGDVQGEELRGLLRAAVTALEAGRSPAEFADSQGWAAGIGGYINHTVPAALYCWANSPDDFCSSVESAVLLGGDTDSVAAITGAVSGANLGSDRIPVAWLDGLAEWPRSVAWMQHLATALADEFVDAYAADQEPFDRRISMRWWATLPRNFVFASIVLGLGLRRLLPPY